MEKLKAMIPDHLRHMVAASAPDDLFFTCSALFDYLHPSQHFRQIVKQLSDPGATTCGKDQVAASQWKNDGNAAFAQGDYHKALNCYMQVFSSISLPKSKERLHGCANRTKIWACPDAHSALRCIPLGLGKIDNTMVATLHFNRASALRKMGMLKESIRDCSRAIKLHPSHSKAWYCKGQANAGLKNFEDAINDMHTSLAFENSSLGRKQVKSELESIMQVYERAKGVLECQQTIDQDDFDIGDDDICLPEVAEVHIVSTVDKGQEIQAKNIVLPGDLVFHEEPYVAVILKQFRDTHCHFCFRELPGDAVPCEFCTIPLYCSENCREHAGGCLYGSKHSKNISEQTSDGSHHDIVTLCLSDNDSCKISHMDTKNRDWSEHKHECGGMSWAAVLPTEVILAARMFMKSIEKQSNEHFQNLSTGMNLCHHYEKMQPLDKLELHIFAIVLACCLQYSTPGMFQLSGTSISELVLLIARVKVNAMAIVHMSSPDKTKKRGISIETKMTCSIEQVRVAQAIYLRGSAFNHSCDPNIHASFISRSLLVHAIKYLPPGSPLELCYGTQVGESGLEYRQRWLKQHYFFVCKCMGCSELNLSDLVLSSFRCAKHDCQGVVLDKAVIKLEKVVGFDVVAYVNVCTRDLTFPADQQNQRSINAVAPLLIAPENASMRHISPGHCLSCESLCDLERKQEVANRNLECLKRIYGEIHVHCDKQKLLDDALQSLQSLMSVLHAFNKDIAKAEDIVAEMFCLTLQPQSALHHCKESTRILEKLYHSDHIVVANELVKLVSIALALNKYEYAKKNLARIGKIFSRHYGCNYAKLFPYLRSMQKISGNMVGEI